jgi:1-acyl-sn-glycerol-3-phosphate acyltransferase
MTQQKLMRFGEQIAQYRQLLELAAIAGSYHCFRVLGKAIDEDEGILEQRVSQLAGRHLVRHLQLEVETIGLEHLHGLQQYCVACNHASYLDWAVLLGYFPTPLRFIAKKELAKIPFVGHYLKSRGVLIDREEGLAALRAIRNAVKENAPWPILIFPEGTRSPDGQIQPFKPGGLGLMYQAKMTILPVCLIGTYEALSRNDRLVKTGRKIRLVVSPPVQPHEYSSKEEAVAEVERRMRSAFEEYKI